MKYQEPPEKLLTGIVPIGQIESHILNIRGQKVMLDSYLAEIYQVETKVLNQAVKRNIERFPEDFMFQLTANEEVSLRSQIVTSKTRRGGRQYEPYVFTQEGVAMLSSVLNSERAIQVNISIMRTFVKMRSVLTQEKVMADLVSQVVVEVLTEVQKRGLFDSSFNATATNSSSTEGSTTSTVTTSAYTDSITSLKLAKKQLLATIKPYDEYMDSYGKKVVLEALEICNFNKSLTMKRLRVSESKFYRLLKKYNISNDRTINSQIG